jgi:hypothetical protein
VIGQSPDPFLRVLPADTGLLWPAHLCVLSMPSATAYMS